jgi:hypothetical protein
MAEPQDTMMGTAIADALALQAAATAASLVISDDVALQVAVALETLAAAPA